MGTGHGFGGGIRAGRVGSTALRDARRSSRLPSPSVPRGGVFVVFDTVSFARKRGNFLYRNVSLTLEPGKVTGLVGVNGSGKTTFMRLVVGDVKPTAGAVRVHGSGMGHEAWGIRQESSPLAGIPHCDDRQVSAVGVPSALLRHPAEVFGFSTASQGFPPRWKAAAILGHVASMEGVSRSRVHDVVTRLGLGAELGLKADSLSTGMRKRLDLALAMLADPPVMVWDEPLNGLDILAVRSMRDIIKDMAAQGKTVLVSSHDLSELDLVADVVYAIHDRRIVRLDTQPGKMGGIETAFLRMCAGPLDESVRTMDARRASHVRGTVARSGSGETAR